MGIEQDLPPGEQLLPYFRRFIEHLTSSSLSPKTIRNHVDNLWSLGGEIIRDLHYDKRCVSMTLRHSGMEFREFNCLSFGVC